MRYFIGAVAVGAAGLAYYKRKSLASLISSTPTALTPENARKALVDEGGNVKRAATRLGCAEKTLHAIMNQEPGLRDFALNLRLKQSRTGYGRPPRHVKYSP